MLKNNNDDDLVKKVKTTSGIGSVNIKKGSLDPFAT